MLAYHYILKNLGKKVKSRRWAVILHAIFIEGVFLQRKQTKADLKCERKKPSVRYKLTIDAIGVIIMTIQSFSRLVGIWV